MTKFLHIGDNHLRDVHLSRRDRGDDFTRALHQCVDIGISEGVAAILQCGDLFDSNRPSAHIIRRVLPTIQQKLLDARMPMYVVNGDHDKTDPPWATFDTVAVDAGIHVLENQLITVPGTDITIYGLDFIGKTKERFLEVRDQLPAADILMWHTQVKEFAGFYGQDAVSMVELPVDKYRFIALGDIHTCQYIAAGNGCVVGYPGSSELCKSDEPLQKTVTVIEFNEHHSLGEVRQRNLATRLAKVYRMHTDEDVIRVLNELEQVKNQNPMVFGRYNAQIPNVMARFCAVLNPDKAIIRLIPYAENQAPHEVDAMEADKQPADFLKEFLPPGSALYDLALACLRVDAPANDLITDFVEKRLNIAPFAP